VPDRGALLRIFAVAELTIATERTAVRIVASMASLTVARRPEFAARGLTMTGFATEVLVATRQWKIGAGDVVELPSIPTIGAVTALAVRTQLSVVFVFGAVARHATHVGSLESPAVVARLARGRCVKAQ